MNKKKILVIDDEPEILEQVKKRLEANRFDCLTALDPVTGLARARSDNPDLILLDLMLPGMSGLGVLRELKKDAGLARIPVVILTALGDEEICREAMDLGAAGYLRKTCTPTELLNMVQEYAGR
jgi:two-component system phosphate regulon response regulator PhoB